MELGIRVCQRQKGRDRFKYISVDRLPTLSGKKPKGSQKEAGCNWISEDPLFSPSLEASKVRPTENRRARRSSVHHRSPHG